PPHGDRSCPSTAMSATATAPVRVLMVEDDERDFLLARELFAATGRDLRLLEWVRTADEALARLRENCHPIVLLDLRLGAASGLDVLRQARAAGCRSRFIFIVTRTGDID